MKEVPSTGGKTLWGGMFMDAAQDHNREQTRHSQAQGLSRLNGRVSYCCCFLCAQQMSPADDVPTLGAPSARFRSMSLSK